MAVEVRGKRASVFAEEGGGHRWQRTPPTEKRGRVHTSTVTVAVLVPTGRTSTFDPMDVEIEVARGTGNGGQARNKHESCVTAIHRPTGLRARVDGRSQWQNRETALRVLGARVGALADRAAGAAENERRRDQVGSGQRGDKIRTYREQDNRVTDHRTGRTWSLDRWRKGIW